jgi:hypothetical protein
LVTEQMISGAGANRRDWAPLRFASPKEFDVATVVKLAAAIDYRQTLIAVIDNGDRLEPFERHAEAEGVAAESLSTF